MALTTYSYTISTQLSTADFEGEQLAGECVTAGLPLPSIDSLGDTLNVRFDPALTDPQKGTLDGLASQTENSATPLPGGSVLGDHVPAAAPTVQPEQMPSGASPTPTGEGEAAYDTVLDELVVGDGAAAQGIPTTLVPQAEAEAGADTRRRIWTAERVAQAIAALASGEANPALIAQAVAEAGTDTAPLLFSALRVAQAIAALETGEANPAAASQGEAEAGTEAALRTFSPLRIAQAIAALETTPAPPVYVDYYASGVTGITTAAGTVTLNVERQSDAAFTLAASEITVNAGGVGDREIHYGVNLDEASANDACVDCWLELNSVEIPGTRCRIFHDNTSEEGGGSGFAIPTLALNDVIRLRAQVVTGSDQMDTRADGVRLMITTPGGNGADGAAGPQGPQGIPGAGSTINLENDGIALAGGPFDRINMIGGGAVDAGAGQADYTPPGGGGGGELFTGYHTVAITSIPDVPTWTDVTLGAESKKTANIAHTLASADVTVNKTGTFKVSASLTAFTPAASVDRVGFRIRLVKNGSIVLGTEGSGYLRDNPAQQHSQSSATIAPFAVDLTSGDVIKLQVAMDDGTNNLGVVDTVANQAFLTIEEA